MVVPASEWLWRSSQHEAPFAMKGIEAKERGLSALAEIPRIAQDFQAHQQRMQSQQLADELRVQGVDLKRMELAQRMQEYQSELGLRSMRAAVHREELETARLEREIKQQQEEFFKEHPMLRFSYMRGMIGRTIEDPEGRPHRLTTKAMTPLTGPELAEWRADEKTRKEREKAEIEKLRAQARASESLAERRAQPLGASRDPAGRLNAYMRSLADLYDGLIIDFETYKEKALEALDEHERIIQAGRQPKKTKDSRREALLRELQDLKKRLKK